MTKYLITSLMLILSVELKSQENQNNYDFPFQVIYATESFRSSREQIDSLNFLSLNDTITVNEKGLISLMHYSGLPIEFSGDTTFTVKLLNQIVSGDEKKRQANKHYRPNINLLYISNPRERRKERLSSRGACHDCNLNLYIINPPHHPSEPIHYSTELNIEWISSNSDNYDIKIFNMNLDTLAIFTAKTNKMCIENIDSLSKTAKNGFLLLSISDSVHTSSPVLVKSFERKFDYPFGLVKNATAALILALKTEIFYQQLPEQTLAYYQLASELSEHAFFNRILSNYVSRSKK